MKCQTFKTLFIMKTLNIFFGIISILILTVGFIALSKCESGSVKSEQLFFSYFFFGMLSIAGFLVTAKKDKQLQN